MSGVVLNYTRVVKIRGPPHVVNADHRVRLAFLIICRFHSPRAFYSFMAKCFKYS